jgi:threonine dehydratase
MKKLNQNDVEEAYKRILKWVRITPIIRMQGPGARPIIIKLEGFQRSGSFKLRGALNKLISLGSKTQSGVIAASGGNHGLGLAWAGWLTGVTVKVFVPSTTPTFKRHRLEQTNAEVVYVDGGYAEAEAAARQDAHMTSKPYIHAYNDLEVIAGQATVVREFKRQAPELKTVVAAIGGGGLASGAIVADDTLNVVGVEPAGAATMHTALALDRPVSLGEINTIAADSLGAKTVGELTFEICKRGLNRVELVSDESLIAAQEWLWKHLRCPAELGACAGLAALTDGGLDQDEGPIGIIICGSNLDPKYLIGL